MLPAATAVKLPVVPNLYSIRSVAIIDSVTPLNFTSVVEGVAGRRGSITSVGNDAGFPFAALSRMLCVTSLTAVALGIRLAIFNGFAVIAVHLVPFVLYSMRFDTPVTVSLRASIAKPVGDVVAASGMVTFLIFEDGAAAVALLRTMTVAASLPNTLLGRYVAVNDVQEVPPLRLYSIAVETPVTLSVEPLYTTFGAALRAGTDTERVADANVESVALTRT